VRLVQRRDWPTVTSPQGFFVSTTHRGRPHLTHVYTKLGLTLSGYSSSRKAARPQTKHRWREARSTRFFSLIVLRFVGSHAG